MEYKQKPQKAILFEQHYSISDVATQLNVSSSLVRLWLSQGHLNCVRVGNGKRIRVLIPHSSVEKMLQHNQAPNPEKVAEKIIHCERKKNLGGSNHE